MNNFELQFIGNRFWEIVWKFPCPQKILMVTTVAATSEPAGSGFPSSFLS